MRLIRVIFHDCCQCICAPFYNLEKYRTFCLVAKTVGLVADISTELDYREELRVNSLCSCYHPQQYEVKAPMPSGCFRHVCKQMTKMHEAIHELLPEEQTQVSTRRFTSFTSCLTLKFALFYFYFFYSLGC